MICLTLRPLLSPEKLVEENALILTLSDYNLLFYLGSPAD